MLKIRLLIYVTVIWSGYTVLAAYHLQDNTTNWQVNVTCADQSEACSDQLEDINGGQYGE